MPKLPEIVPVTDLRQDAAAVLERVRRSTQPLVITRRGRAAAIMISPESFERSENERHILKLLARGEREIAKGKGFDLDSVLADADEFLARR
jgi:prevent-host-death family protein